MAYATIFWLCEPQKCREFVGPRAGRCACLVTLGRVEPKPEPIWRITSGSVSRLSVLSYRLIYVAVFSLDSTVSFRLLSPLLRFAFFPSLWQSMGKKLNFVSRLACGKSVCLCSLDFISELFILFISYSLQLHNLCFLINSLILTHARNENGSI